VRSFLGTVYIHKVLYDVTCRSACLLKTREWLRRLSPNFQGSSRAPRGWFKAQKTGVVDKGAANLTVGGKLG